VQEKNLSKMCRNVLSKCQKYKGMEIDLCFRSIGQQRFLQESDLIILDAVQVSFRQTLMSMNEELV
jgi:hypothetical protein